MNLPTINLSSNNGSKKMDFHPDVMSFAELGGTDDQTENHEDHTSGNETLDALYMEQFSLNRKSRNLLSSNETDPDRSKSRSGPPKEFDI